VTSTFTLTNYPKELQKKVTLLQHFRGYLEGDSNDKEKQVTSSDDNSGGLGN